METKLRLYLLSLVWKRSYPTYEEWKPANEFTPTNGVWCSYPTYEEWKRVDSLEDLNEIGVVLILPMRNGNMNNESYVIANFEFLSYL